MKSLGRHLEHPTQAETTFHTEIKSMERSYELVERRSETAYPRPQLQRSNWKSLNGPWKFTYDDEGQWIHPKEIAEWPNVIEVPFAPESARSGIGDTGFHPNCWYEREFEVPEGEGRVILHFGAVDYRARVWV